MTIGPEIKNPAEWQFNAELVRSILDKMGRDDRYTKVTLASLSFEELYLRLNSQETDVIKQLLSLSPKELGFLGPFVSMEGPPDDLVHLESQVFTREGH